MYHYGVVEKRINLQKFVQITSTNAAKRFGIYPRKGLLERGSDADIVIIDPNEQTKIKAEKLHMNTNFCPFEDLTVNGKTIDAAGGSDKTVATYTANCVSNIGASANEDWVTITSTSGGIIKATVGAYTDTTRNRTATITITGTSDNGNCSFKVILKVLNIVNIG